MRFLVDFNDIFDDDLIEAALSDSDDEYPGLEYLSLDLEPGSVVRIHDGTGHETGAVVLNSKPANDETVILLVIDWATWTSKTANSTRVFQHRQSASPNWTVHQPA